MIIDHNDDTETWNGEDHHSFLIRSERQRHDPFPLVMRLKEIANSHPIHSARIVCKNHFNDNEWPVITEEMLYFAGMWPAPFTRWNNKYVINPNYVHAYRYSDLLVQCECGALVLHTEELNDQEFQHENCPVYQKHEAYAKLNKRRASLLRTMLRAGYDAADIANRWSAEHSRIDTAVALSLGVDIQREKRIGRKLVNETMGRLIQEYPPEQVGKLYGLTAQTVRRRVRDQTPYSPSAALECRQQKRPAKPLGHTD